LQNGDRIIEINGTNMEDKNHAEIAELIKECVPKNEITFCVIAAEDDPNFQRK